MEEKLLQLKKVRMVLVAERQKVEKAIQAVEDAINFLGEDEKTKTVKKRKTTKKKTASKTVKKEEAKPKKKVGRPKKVTV